MLPKHKILRKQTTQNFGPWTERPKKCVDDQIDCMPSIFLCVEYLINYSCLWEVCACSLSERNLCSSLYEGKQKWPCFVCKQTVTAFGHTVKKKIEQQMCCTSQTYLLDRCKVAKRFTYVTGVIVIFLKTTTITEKNKIEEQTYQKRQKIKYIESRPTECTHENWKLKN